MRNRVVSFRLLDPNELSDHPQNWREHPNTQRAALREVLERIGIAGVILAYKSAATGKLTVIDGHLRKSVMSGETKVPVVTLDLTDEEAAAVLASHDPIGQMARRNDDLYAQVVQELEGNTDYADLMRMLDVDAWKAPQDDDEGVYDSKDPAEYEITPVYDEGYDALIVACSTDSEWAQLRTILNLKDVRDRHGKVGTTHVIPFAEFAKLWPSK